MTDDLLPFVTLLALVPAGAAAQTDYFNTDAARPVVIEDAYPVERYAFEFQVAPLRMERSDAGAYHWELEPEIAFGALPRTQVEAGIHLDVTDQAEAGRNFGIGGIEIAVLHNLNVETRTWPALAVAGDLRIPVGSFAPDGLYPSLKGIATRTFGIGRLHVNGEYTFGSTQPSDDRIGDLSRWLVGLAADRSFPIDGALLTMDVFVEGPLTEGADLAWSVEAGGRYQLDPFFALDAGVGRRFTGDDPAWFVTVGAARTFGIQSLIPLRGR